LSLKTRVIGAAHSKDFVILGAAILIQWEGVTDEWTNKTPQGWLRSAKHYMLSCTKTTFNFV